MKKSELRSLIREILHEEMKLHEGRYDFVDGLIDEKGLFSTMHRTVGDYFKDTTIVQSSSEVTTVATIPSENDIPWSITGDPSSDRIYSFALTPRIPKEFGRLKTSKAFNEALKKFKSLYDPATNKSLTHIDEVTVECKLLAGILYLEVHVVAARKYDFDTQNNLKSKDMYVPDKYLNLKELERIKSGEYDD